MTIIYMRREFLITKEKMLNFCNGKEALKKSVNDDLNSFFEDLRLGKQPDYLVPTYFLPQLTEEELELIEQKDENFMKTFSDGMFSDVEKAEMAASESESKYVHAYGNRKTYTIENTPKEDVSISCILL